MRQTGDDTSPLRRRLAPARHLRAMPAVPRSPALPDIHDQFEEGRILPEAGKEEG